MLYNFQVFLHCAKLKRLKVTMIRVKEMPKNKLGEENYIRTVGDSEYINISCWNWLHIFTILILFTLIGSPLFLIPKQNSIFYPHYWYESYFNVVITGLYSAANILLNCSVFTKNKSLTSPRIFIKIWAWNILNGIIPYTICYVIWVLYLGKNWPMPFVELGKMFAWAALLYGIWFLFPKKLLNDEDFRRKLRTYILYSLWWFVMNLQRDILTIVFKHRSAYMEWIFAFVIPCVRELNRKVLTKLVHRMAGSEDEPSTVLLGLTVNVHYALFIAIRLTGFHFTTVISMVIIEFMMHLKMAYSLTKLQNKVATNQNEEERLKRKIKKTAMNLVLAELCEGLVPIGYSIGFSLMCFGPNAHIFGQSNTTLLNLFEMFKIMVLLFGIDILSALLNGVLLKTISKIDINRKFCEVLKKYWHFMVLKLSLTIFLTLSSKDLNSGTDWTLKFPWMTDEGRQTMIFNSTTLSEAEKAILLNNSIIT